jgi:hypothetical protein
VELQCRGALAREEVKGYAIEWWKEWPRLRWCFYISGGWESGGPERVACCGGADSMLQFRLREEATRWSIIGRWSGGNELILIQWEGSVTRCGGMATSAGGEVAPWREKGGDDVSWADANLTGLKKWRRSTRSIQLLQMDGEDLKQRWINLFIFLKYMQVRSSFVHLIA